MWWRVEISICGDCGKSYNTMNNWEGKMLFLFPLDWFKDCGIGWQWFEGGGVLSGVLGSSIIPHLSWGEGVHGGPPKGCGAFLWGKCMVMGKLLVTSSWYRIGSSGSVPNCFGLEAWFRFVRNMGTPPPLLSPLSPLPSLPSPLPPPSGAEVWRPDSPWSSRDTLPRGLCLGSLRDGATSRGPHILWSQCRSEVKVSHAWTQR